MTLVERLDPLSVDRIVAAALDLMEEAGIDAVSTRKVAAKLHVKGPAIYRHFPSMAALFDQMATTILTSGYREFADAGDWTDLLRHIAHQSRTAILSHRDGARLIINSSPTHPRRSQLAEYAFRHLVDAGFDEKAARLAAATVNAFVIGWTLNESNPETCGLIRRDYGEPEVGFERALENIITGIGQNGRIWPQPAVARSVTSESGNRGV